MRKADVQFSNIPDSPGVYIFRGPRKQILYVGKATSLRNRVRSYFSKDLENTRGPLIVNMLEAARSVDYEATDSVLEALILEANLIKKHQPPHNTRDKDNKSFAYVVITNETFPRILRVRGRELFTTWKERDIKYIFGPFSSGGILKDALSIIRKILPYRDKCAPDENTPCFNRQIGLCPGVCTGEVTAREYGKRVQQIRLLLEGKKGRVVAALEKEMKAHAKREEFEKAEEYKRRIFALTHIRETALLGSDYKVSTGAGTGRIEAYDVAHISETSRVGVMVVVTDGKAEKNEYRKFTIRTEQKGDIAALEEILRRRFEHVEWQLPSLIVIDGGVAQKNAAKRVMDEFGFKIPIVNVVKNERHKAARIVGNEALLQTMQDDILLANAEAHRFAVSFYRLKQRKNLR